MMKAIYKAKRLGRRRVLYITSPAGMRMAKIIPRADMVARLLLDAMVKGKISYFKYQEDKDLLIDYLMSLEDWLQSSLETSVKKVKKSLRKKHIEYYLKNVIINRKELYLNTQFADNFFYFAKKVDEYFKYLLIGSRYNLVSFNILEKAGKELNVILTDFEQDITKIGVALWQG